MDKIKKMAFWKKGSESKRLLQDCSTPTGLSEEEAQDPPSGEGDEDTLNQELAAAPEDGPRIIRGLVERKFPPVPEELPRDLLPFLLTMQEAMRQQLSSLGPPAKRIGLLGTLVQCCHHQVFHCLCDLLQKANNSQSLFTLLQWVLQTYLSQEMFIQLRSLEWDVIKEIDLLVLTEWVMDAKAKLLQKVKEDFSVYIERILEEDRMHPDPENEEACIQVYMDIIQFTEAMPTNARKASWLLAVEVQQVCFQELLKVLQRYTAEQTEMLKKKKKMEEREIIYILKTLKTCTEIKEYVRTRTKDLSTQLLCDTVAVLERTEAFVLDWVKKMVRTTAEGFLQSYFTSKNKQFFHLIDKVQNCFPKRKWCQDVMEKVMAEAYKIIVHVYLKRLVKVPLKKLNKHWSTNVGQMVQEDASILHNTISELVPGVKSFNLILLKAAELLECDYDMLLLTIACMHKESVILREDQDLLVALLKWKGLPGWQIREVVEAIPGCPRSTSSCCSCLS